MRPVLGLRVLGFVVFGGIMVYGMLGAVSLGFETLKPMLIWAVGGLVLHDAVFVPAVLTVGWLVGRIRRSVLVALQVLALVGGTVLLATLPTWMNRGNATAEPGLLEQDYVQNVIGIVAVVLVVAVVTGVVSEVRTRRRAGLSAEGALSE